MIINTFHYYPSRCTCNLTIIFDGRGGSSNDAEIISSDPGYHAFARPWTVYLNIQNSKHSIGVPKYVSVDHLNAQPISSCSYL